MRVTPYDGVGAGSASESANFNLDLTAPTYVSSRYIDNNTDGTVDYLYIVFSENISAGIDDLNDLTITGGDINLALSNIAGTSLTEAVFAATADAHETGGTIAPTVQYTKNIGWLRDNYGNQVASFSAQTISDAADPMIASISPASGSTITASQSIVTTFTEPMDTGTVTYTFSSAPSSTSDSWSSGDTILTISHSSFIVGSNTYTVTAADDLAGRSLAGAIAGVTHPAIYSVSSGSSTTKNIDFIENYSVELAAGELCAEDNVIPVKLVGSNISEYIISISEDFLDASWVSFAPIDNSAITYGPDGQKIYTVVTTLTLPGEGDYLVYTKFRSRSGNLSNTLVNAIQIDLMNNCIEEPVSGGDTGSGGQTGGGGLPNAGDTGISPVTGEEEVISPTQTFEFIKGLSLSEIYWLGQENKRHPLMNALTFYTYEKTREAINQITDATVGEIELGSVLVPKSGTVLIKFNSSPKVYFISEDQNINNRAVLRHIPNEAAANEIIGVNWKNYIFEIEPTFYPRFEIGNPIFDNEVLDTSALISISQLMELSQE